MKISNADYSEQKQIQQVRPPQVVTVVGTGAFGAWAAFFSALAGVERLVLINPGSANPSDRHNVQGREIAIGPYLDSDIGRPKVEALADIIRGHRPLAQVHTHVLRWEPEHSDLLEGVVFSGISSDRYQAAVWKAAAANELPCFTGAYNGVMCGVASSLAKVPAVDAAIPAWLGSAAMSGLLAVQAAFVGAFDFAGDPAEALQAAIGRKIRVMSHGNI